MWLKALLVAYLAATPIPEADVEVSELSWLSGYWRGEGLGGQCEEIWSAPMGGTMMGTFRLVKDGAVEFYEMMILTREKAGLVMKLKHFTPELVGWEEKADTVTFELERLEPGKAFFEGLTIERDGDRLEVRVRIKYKGGEVRDEPFVFRRYEPEITETTPSGR